jgi:hypothetical protein
MHRAPQYIQGFPFGNHGNPTTYALNSSEANDIREYLKEDAIDYIYSATITVADALRGIEQSLFSWATVKLYYATFYSCRALLALDGDCIFYFNNKPYIIKAVAGNISVKGKGATHKVVLDEFKRAYRTSKLISQQIDYLDVITWLMNKREEVNYKLARFQEPNIPDLFLKINISGIRTMTQAYLQDSSYLYLFDKDHAMVAHPLKMLQHAYGEMHSLGLEMTDEDVQTLSILFKDKKGLIPEFQRMIKR